MAKVREDIGLQAVSRRSKYDFAGLKKGSSLHVKTNSERNRLLAAFNYWGTNIKKNGAWATSRKVGEDDPDGPGFRVWFMTQDRRSENVIKVAELGKDDDEI